MTKEELEDGLQAVINKVLVPDLDLMYGKEAVSVSRETMKNLFDSHLALYAEVERLKSVLITVRDCAIPPDDWDAKETINKLNNDVNVVTYKDRINSNNIMDIIKDYDVILDGCDNFPTRYLVNDACVFAKKTNIHGSIFRFEGQATVFKPYEGPCYRCLYPQPPPPGAVPSCQEAGVLGVLPGIIGVIQAIEAIKIILGIGESLIGRLLMYDALDMEFRELKIRKDST